MFEHHQFFEREGEGAGDVVIDNIQVNGGGDLYCFPKGGMERNK